MCVIDTPAIFLNASPARCWVLPAPEDAKLKLSGLAFICATSSRTSRALTEGPTISTLGTTMTSATGVRSLSASKLSLSRCGAIACPVLVATSSVCPSGGDLAVKSAAMVFDAPGRLSTTNGCLSDSPSLSASVRATMSVPPPAVAPTSRCTALVGYACALASFATGDANAKTVSGNASAHPWPKVRRDPIWRTMRLAALAEGDDFLSLLSEPLDAQGDDVSRLQVLGDRLHAHPHARWRARCDDVARQQRHISRY